MLAPFLLAASLLCDPSTETPPQKKSEDSCYRKIHAAFVSIGGGYAWSGESSVRASTKDWDPSPQGYNSDLHQSEVYTFGLGYHFKHPISVLFEAGYRPNFKYRKFQTSNATGTSGFLGEKTRHFRLSSLAFTFNALFNKEGNCLRWKWSQKNCFSMAPFFGAGLGVSYNDVYDFHSVLPIPPGDEFHPVRSIENNKIHASFAGQVVAGIVFKASRRFSFDIGYRWFYGGRFLSNDYLIDIPVGSSSAESSTPWKGILKANEVFLNLNYIL